MQGKRVAYDAGPDCGAARRLLERTIRAIRLLAGSDSGVTLYASFECDGSTHSDTVTVEPARAWEAMEALKLFSQWALDHGITRVEYGRVESSG